MNRKTIIALALGATIAGTGLAQAQTVTGVVQPGSGRVGENCARFVLMTGSGSITLAWPVSDWATGLKWTGLVAAAHAGSSVTIGFLPNSALPCGDNPNNSLTQATSFQG